MSKLAINELQNGSSLNHDFDFDSQMETLSNKIKSLQSSLNTSSNIKQFPDILNDINTTQHDINLTLQNYANENIFQQQSTIRSLEISRVELSSTLNQSRSLKSIMENANSLSYKITENVRILDSEKVQLIKLKTFVDNVKTLKTELNNTHLAIERKDWLSASKSIFTIRELPDGLITDPYVEFKVPTSTLEDLPKDLLNRWINELEQIFVENFNNAAVKKDVPQLTYFFQLFPLIGKQEIGLKCYSNFICGIISEQSRNIIRSVQNNQSKTDIYAQLLFTLYQTLSVIINQHSKVIKSYYGKDVVPSILKDIQVECDLQSNLIFETYSDVKHLERTVSELKQYSYPILIKEIYRNVAESESEEEDDEQEIVASAELKEISQVTDELSAMMSHWSMYSKFFVVVWNEYSNSNSNNLEEKIYPNPLLFSSFGIKVHDKLVSHFDTSCTYIIRRTLEKACTIESLNSPESNFSTCLKFLTQVYKNTNNSLSNSLLTLIPEDPPISSLADDMVIVLNTIFLEVLATGELASIKNMISNIKRILLNDFLNIIKQRLSSLSLRTNSNLLTKETIQSIYKPNDQHSYNKEIKNISSDSRSRSGTPNAINVSASDIANTGAMFMRGLNAAISYTVSGDSDTESYLIGDDKDIKPFIIYLNTLQAMGTYLDKLVESCMKSSNLKSLLIMNDQELINIRKTISLSDTNKLLNKDFDVHVPDESLMFEKIYGLLGSVPTAFKERTDSIINNSVKILFEKVLKSRITKLVNSSLNSNYLLTMEDGQYFRQEINNNINNNANGVNNNLNRTTKVLENDSNMTAFIKNWNSIIIPFVTTLSNPVFNKLIVKIIKMAIVLLENKIWQLEKKVSSAGSTKLEQDVSTIISELCKFNYGLRSEFVKITQIVLVVGLEDEEEMAIFEDAESGIEWVLTPSEKSRARKLRTV